MLNPELGRVPEEQKDKNMRNVIFPISRMTARNILMHRISSPISLVIPSHQETTSEEGLSTVEGMWRLLQAWPDVAAEDESKALAPVNTFVTLWDSLHQLLLRPMLSSHTLHSPWEMFTSCLFRLQTHFFYLLAPQVRSSI